MVMESRKAAPALRARLLRSYVPLRRDPSESVLSGTIPGLPGGNFLHPQIQISHPLTVMMRFFKHHILDFHQADLGASFILVQFHCDIFDIFLGLRNDYMFQCIYTSSCLSISAAMSWHAFSHSASRIMSGRMSARDFTAPSRSLDVNAKPYE